MSEAKDVADLGKAGELPADPASETRRVLPPSLVSVGPDDALPHVLAERALLASLLWAATYDPGSAAASNVAHLVEAKMFDGAGHGPAFAAMLVLEAAGGTPEPVAVSAEAARQGTRIDHEYLEALATRATQPTDIKLRQWATQIRDAWSKRQLAQYARKVLAAAGDPKTNAQEAHDAAHEQLTRLEEGTVVGGAIVSAVDAAHQLYRELDDNRPAPVLPTGFRDFDGMQGGLFLEDISILAARTSVGKSLLAMAIARNVAQAGHVSLYVSLEMAAKMFVMRSVCADVGVSLKKMRMKACLPAEIQAIAAAMNALPPGLMFIDNTVQTCGSISAEAQRLQSALAKKGKRISLLVIDHVHLIKPDKDYAKLQRVDQMTAVTRWMISISRSLRCHVLGCAQISRAAENQGKDTRPMLQHIREAGAFEENVNNVYILHRKKLKSGKFADDAAQLIVAKARNDATGTIRLGFEGKRMRFTDYEPPLADLPSRQYVHGAFPEEDDS